MGCLMHRMDEERFHLQATVLRWEGDSSAWESDTMNPETVMKRFRNAVLHLVDDDSYHARRRSAAFVIDLYGLTDDMQVFLRLALDSIAPLPCVLVPC